MVRTRGVRGTVRSAAILAVIGVAACDVREPVVIPPGAQVVHVTVTDDAVELEPASVQAGDVYLVLEGPNAGYAFVSRSGPGCPIDRDVPGPGRSRGAGRLPVHADRGASVSCAADEWTQDRHWEDLVRTPYSR